MLRSRIVVALFAAVVCLFALASANASAEVMFRIGSGTVANVEGKGSNYTFKFGSIEVDCTTETHRDERQPFPSTQIIEKITYEGCTVFVGGIKLASEVVVEEEWNFHSAVSSTFLGRWLVQVPSVGCTITNPKQEVSAVAYTKAGESLAVTEAYKGITYEVNKACEAVGVTGSKNGEVKGKSLLKAVTKEGAATKMVSLEIK